MQQQNIFHKEQELSIFAKLKKLHQTQNAIVINHTVMEKCK